ncbi:MULTISPECIES: hypothetical protein [Chryseobacterium]|uniref:Uncharacterized protein n=1 Tax=Candidatus Chryseobacterium massiliense TaxID=204089 RepID=A0A3D9AWL3_9FLAO|nr:MULTISPECIES: hypothetical protein [Chryseobacterium]REC45377.1 hypothetical protein DRF68_15735 [Candidatus Chryseobacterium massiliae]
MRPYLKIEKSCEESLKNMHTIPEGKFCDLCSKKVYDLTKLTHSEISDIAEQNHGKKFCGILINKEPEQKREETFSIREDISHRKNTFTKVAAGIALSASLVNTLPAQTKDISKTQVILTGKNLSTEKNKNTEGGEKLTASGRIVTSEEGKPVKAYVNLITINKVYSTETNEDGFYSLEIPQELAQEENYLLEFSPFSYNFDQKLKVFSRNELRQNTVIKLPYNGTYKELGEVSFGPPYAEENSIVFLHGKRLDYKLYNKSYSLYSSKYDIHYIPKPYTKFFTESDLVKDIFIVFVK